MATRKEVFISATSADPDSDEARKAVRELLPKVATCAVFITSRFSGNLSGVRRQELALFDIEESREYTSASTSSQGCSPKRAAKQCPTRWRRKLTICRWPLSSSLTACTRPTSRAAEWLEEWRTDGRRAGWHEGKTAGVVQASNFS